MVTSALAIEERNASGSKTGEATSHSQSSVCRNNCNKQDPVGNSLKFMINLSI